MAVLAAASKEYKWYLRLGEIAGVWRGGCIIRAGFLNEIRRAIGDDSALKNLMLAPSMKRELEGKIGALRPLVSAAASNGVAAPALSASLSYFDSYITERLPQNLSQAQRDYFGVHTYQRIDRDGIFHSRWEE